MHKIHWGTLFVAATAGVALSAIPSNSIGEEAQTTIHNGAQLVSIGGAEIAHGIIVICVVAIAVFYSRAKKQEP